MKKDFFILFFFNLIILSFVIPITVRAHYIFAILISFFSVLFFIKKPIKVFILSLLLFFYFLPIINKQYFKNASRTYEQISSCFKKFCSSFKEAIYVSVISDFHPYHYGPEHRYLLIKNGCLVFNIEEDKNKTDLMLVILDSGKFSQKTKYYELELFGDYQIITSHYCYSNFGYVLLKKKTY